MVKIAEFGSDETFSIPVDQEGFLLLQIFERYFPGAAGLMYLSEDGKEEIPVSFDELMKKLLLPADRLDKIFYIVWPSGAQNNLRQASPYHHVQARKAYMKKLLSYILLIKKENIKCCVTIATQNLAITAAHCLPTDWKLFQTLPLFHMKDDQQDIHNAQIIYVNTDIDFACLKCDNGFPQYPKSFYSPYSGQKVYCTGLPTPMFSGIECSSNDELIVIQASIMHINVKPAHNKHSIYATVYPGPFGGNSGGGIFNQSSRLMGINIGGKDHPPRGNMRTSNFASLLKYVNEPAYSYIVPIYFINSQLDFLKLTLKYPAQTPKMIPLKPPASKIAKLEEEQFEWIFFQSDDSLSEKFLQSIKNSSNDKIHSLVRCNSNQEEDDMSSLKIPPDRKYLIFVADNSKVYEIMSQENLDACHIICQAPISLMETDKLNLFLAMTKLRKGIFIPVKSWIEFHDAWKYCSYQQNGKANRLNVNYQVQDEEGADLKSSFSLQSQIILYQVLLFVSHIFPEINTGDVQLTTAIQMNEGSLVEILVKIQISEDQYASLCFSNHPMLTEIYYFKKQIMIKVDSPFKNSLKMMSLWSQKNGVWVSGFAKMIPPFDQALANGLDKIHKIISESTEETSDNIFLLINKLISRIKTDVDNQLNPQDLRMDEA